MRRIQAIAITGHRNLGPDGAAVVRRVIRDIAPSYPGAIWLTGGAVGADQLAADELLARGARVELVLPFPANIQGLHWSVGDRQRLARQIARAQGVEILQDHYSADAYHRRNRRLVQRADLVVAFWRLGQAGGTAFTISEADRRRVPVVICEIK